MQVDISNSIEFNRLLDRLAQDIVDAEIYNRLYVDIDVARIEYRQEFNQSPTFWSLTLRAYVEVILVQLIRAYDTNDRALSLQSLLETIKGNAQFFTGASGGERLDIDQLDRDIASVSPGNDDLVKKLIILRGHVIAHINAANVVEEKRVEDRFSLTFDDINSLVRRATEILNRYSILFKNTAWSTQIVGHSDFKNVLEALRGDLERHDAETLADIECAKSAALSGT